VALLDIVPTRHVFTHVDRQLAQAYYHWFFLAQPDGLPEHLIGGDPSFFLRRKLAHWSADHSVDVFAAEAVAEYLRCFSHPESIHASCEDYRAGASIDLEHDEVDARNGTHIRCPALALWGGRGFVGRHYDVLAVWREYADDVNGTAIDCGHFLAEEAPEPTLTALTDFLADWG
jgi:haloacetate dehalogenase